MFGKSEEFQIGCNVNSYKLQLGVIARSPCYDSKNLFHSKKDSMKQKQNKKSEGSWDFPLGPGL